METRSWIARVLVAAGVLLSAGAALRADDPLKDVKELYAVAAYEETLAALVHLDESASIDQVEEYRALCLLALHRDAEAELAVERLVRGHPLLLEGLNERSPKFAALYQTVRHRLLPGLVNESYSAGRASFAANDYSTAARHFDRTLELLKGAEPPAALGDLELLATEFRALAEERLRPVVQPPPVPEAMPAPAAVIAASAPLPVSAQFAPVPRVYDSGDLDITPPVVLNQTLPQWNPPWAQVAGRTYTGRLQVIVGEDGSVASADILQPSFAPYDGLLLRAAKQWRYQPALKRGQSVQYRRTIDYVLKGSDQTTTQR